MQFVFLGILVFFPSIRILLNQKNLTNVRPKITIYTDNVNKNNNRIFLVISSKSRTKMKRTEKMVKSKKHQQIVDTARDLFWHHGVRRVSVEEICQTAGVSKMTFYKYFKNKIHLVLFILNKTFLEGIVKYKSIMAKNISYSEKIKEVIRMKLEITREISQEMLKDWMQDSIPEVAELMERIQKDNFQLFLDDMIAAQNKGEIRKDINPHFILYFLNKMREIAGDEQMINMYDSTQSLTAELINFFFYGILTKQPEDR